MLREELYRGVENSGLNHLRVGVAWARSLIGPVTVVDFGGSFGEEGLALLDDPVIGADVTYVVCESLRYGNARRNSSCLRKSALSTTSQAWKPATFSTRPAPCPMSRSQ